MKIKYFTDTDTALVEFSQTPVVETRFRPHHFPFTEPSAEIDMMFTSGALLLHNMVKLVAFLRRKWCGIRAQAEARRSGMDSFY